MYNSMQKKAGYIKRVSQILLEKYGGDIPTTMDELVSYSCVLYSNLQVVMHLNAVFSTWSGP